MSSQAHILSVPLHCLEVNGFCVLSRTENSGPAPAHRVPSVHLQEKKINALHCPVLVKGEASPGSSPYLCPTKYAWAMALQGFPQLLGQDEVNGAGSGLGSVMASPNSECALFSLFFLCEDSELPCFQALVPGPFLLPLRGCYAHPNSSAHTSGRYQGNPGTWMGPLNLEPSKYISIPVSCVSLSPTISLPPAAMANLPGLLPRGRFPIKLVLNPYERQKNGTASYMHDSFSSLLSAVAYHNMLGSL